ncbi:GNAT family N-acetyltransferase [Kutzneria chonburiensis]|uniref:GNAT family N-acetyltransferase n=1 Tax=Kutzneria chonburiensis TaxID=1483604 RepID=A0ABV6N8V7_9PSEU|nr:GNAT family N-acetyltransferase [Kutzneria chonburiensis]
MAITLGQPQVDGLAEAVGVLREWQHDDAPMQLHPGDLGWYWRLSAETTAAAVRIWHRDGRMVALGLLDSPTLLRLVIAPDARPDEELARRLVADMTSVLPTGPVGIDAPAGAVIHDVLSEDGWGFDDPWTPLRRDLSEPVPDPGVRVEVVGPALVQARVAVHRAAFTVSTFTVERWHAMAAGIPYADARCLIAFDDQDNAVAAVTVWSAGAGRPGLIEPMGAHPDHRGRGHGKAITLAAAAKLRELGSSSVLVCATSANIAAVATYAAAGMRPLPEVRDRRRAR